eukprot:COSAG02_NODE_7155_length_3151_cov_3.877130_2_plen_366_part_00
MKKLRLLARMGLADMVQWASGTDLLPDVSSSTSPVGHRTLTELSRAGEVGMSPSPAGKFVTPGGGRGPRAGEITPHSSEYADLQRAIEAADIALKNTPKSAKTKQMRLHKLDGSSVANVPPAPASPAGESDEIRERKAHMQRMLDAEIITPAEYTKMVASLRAEAALTPAKQVHAPPVQTADESTASPIFTVDDSMTEPELAALAAERAEAHDSEQAKKHLPNLTGSPATALSAAIDSGLSSAAAARQQQDEHVAAAVAPTTDSELLENGSDTVVPPPRAVVSDPALTVNESIGADAGAEDALPTTPAPLKRAGHQLVEKSPSSAKADGILARWHKWDLDYARDFMHQQMELDELRQLALEFGTL